MAKTSQDFIALEQKYAAHNYHPLAVVFDHAEGIYAWDVEGKRYIDCLSAYSALNQGHCHPKIVKTLVDQAQKLTLASRAFYTSSLGVFAERLTELTGFEMVLPMNTGAEAVETAVKLARKWAYTIKKVEKNKAIVLACENNFHGRTLGIISMSTDPDAYEDYGPFLDNVGPHFPVRADGSRGLIKYNDIPSLEAALDAHGKDVAAFLVEPIQGEAGIVVPAEDYLEKAQALCKKHNVLLIVDEIQTGLGRTGELLCFQHNPRVKPDIITLGKALSGGVYPVSAVLASRDVILTIQPGQHGSTYGGNPLGAQVSITALDVIVNDNLVENAETLGKRMRDGLKALKSPLIADIRGKGLLNAIVIDSSKSAKKRGAWDLCCVFASKGLLAKPTHEHIIRLAPPLIITAEQVDEMIAIIKASLEELDTFDVIPLSEH